MTTIAWDGRFLAADGRRLRNTVIVDDDTTKLYLAGEGIAFASCGIVNWAEAWVAWAMDGSVAGDIPPHGHTEDAGCFIRVTGGVAESCDWRTPYWAAERSPTAWGSGREVAIGAMDMHASAMLAVQIASKRDPATGGTVRYIDTHDPQKGIQVWGVDDITGPLGFNDAMVMAAKAMGGMCDTKEAPLIAEAQMGQALREALTPAWVRIEKPTKIPGPNGDPYWVHPECTGRLVLGTGCGHCLRCNREWHVLLRQPHQTITERTIQVARSEVQAQTTAAPLASAEPQTARQVIEEWVGDWNRAHAAGDHFLIGRLNNALMSMTIPAGLQIVMDPPDADHRHWRRRLVDASAAKAG